MLIGFRLCASVPFPLLRFQFNRCASIGIDLPQTQLKQPSETNFGISRFASGYDHGQGLRNHSICGCGPVKNGDDDELHDGPKQSPVTLYLRQDGPPAASAQEVGITQMFQDEFIQGQDDNE